MIVTTVAARGITGEVGVTGSAKPGGAKLEGGEGITGTIGSGSTGSIVSSLLVVALTVPNGRNCFSLKPIPIPTASKSNIPR